MAYQVLARKWRPRRFDDVIGQRGVTQTLKNALQSGRLGQAYVFAGPRGVGKTTTARILARALNCVTGPTVDPCGQCEPCIEIAEGRDMDVLEIDAATHTGIDNVREVIISPLAIPPMRDRNKIFIIDEVHRFSPQSFDALLKSIEEPPPHVVFMMATTELHKVPETIQSRSQVFELRTISAKMIADQLRRIAGTEKISVDDAALGMIAREAEGSMRDAQSALDQVIAFAGDRVTADDVSTVLGLVGRDLLLDLVEAVANEDPAAIFELVGRAVETGHDLGRVCRDLSFAARDLLLISIDSARLQDQDVAAEGDRERLKSLAARFSREDLLHGFDVLAAAATDIKTAAQPRYLLEMALVRWAHLRKLLPLTEIIEQLSAGRPGGAAPAVQPVRPPPSAVSRRTASAAAAPSRDVPAPVPAAVPAPAPVPAAVPAPAPVAAAVPAPEAPSTLDPNPVDIRESLLAEVRVARKALYEMCLSNARRIAVEGDRIIVAFAPGHRAHQQQVEKNREWLESIATRLAGRKMTLSTVQEASEQATAPAAPAPSEERKARLKAEAMSDAGVQAMLDVFGGEIRDVEEM